MITSRQMAIIARAEAYGEGYLYRHRYASRWYWSERKTGWNSWDWSASDISIKRMIERGLAERINDSTVKITAP